MTEELVAAKLTITRACRITGLSRAAYYSRPESALQRDGAVIDALNGTLGRAQALMRRRRRVGRQRLRIPKVVGDQHQAQRIQEVERRRLAALQAEGDHGAARTHLTRGELVLREALQRRVKHLGKLRIAFQRPGDRLGALRLMRDADIQRLQTLQQDPRIHRTQ